MLHSGELREGMPPLPQSMRKLPVNHQGYPVPFFTQYDNSTKTWDFRKVDQHKFLRCVKENLCYICGSKLGKKQPWFAGGPLCLVNMVNGEPAMHRECAEFSAQVCPFMILPKSKRREAGLSEAELDMGNYQLARNPGAYVLVAPSSWTLGLTENSEPIFTYNGLLEVIWYAEGKLATREQARDALEGSVAAMLEFFGNLDRKTYIQIRNRKVHAELWLPEV